MSRASVAMVGGTARVILASAPLYTGEVRIHNAYAGNLYLRFAGGNDATGGACSATPGTYDICVPEFISYLVDPSKVNAMWGFKAASGNLNVSQGWE